MERSSRCYARERLGIVGDCTLPLLEQINKHGLPPFFTQEYNHLHILHFLKNKELPTNRTLRNFKSDFHLGTCFFHPSRVCRYQIVFSRSVR